MKAVVTWKQRFLRKRLKYMLICVFVVGMIFVVHQLFYFKELNRAVVVPVVSGSPPRGSQRIVTAKPIVKWQKQLYSKRLHTKEGHIVSLRGIPDEHMGNYLPNAQGKFTCILTKDEIDFVRVNDDYCDCPLDGSDEPGTSACNNGVFFCEQPSKSPSKIPSYKVNDGYCDCCDGSDEWTETMVAHRLLDKVLEQETKCEKRC